MSHSRRSHGHVRWRTFAKLKQLSERLHEPCGQRSRSGGRKKKKEQFQVPEAIGRRCCLWDSERKKRRCVPVAAQRGFVGVSSGPARPIPLFLIMALPSSRGLPPTFLNLKSLHSGDPLSRRWNRGALYKSPGYRLTRELSFSLPRIHYLFHLSRLLSRV